MGLVSEVYHIAPLIGSSIEFSTSGCIPSRAVLGVAQPASLADGQAHCGLKW